MQGFANTLSLKWEVPERRTTAGCWMLSCPLSQQPMQRCSWPRVLPDTPGVVLQERIPYQVRVLVSRGQTTCVRVVATQEELLHAHAESTCRNLWETE
jgi:hypothetical protein